MSRFPFSNFQPFPIVYKGIRFPSVEHFYQALKSQDPEDWQRIAALPRPGQAKKAGRGLPLRPDWEEKKVRIMRVALLRKFAPGTKYHLSLMVYQGEIVEWNYWHDLYWGKCLCRRHQGQGQNQLGKLLMEIREAYRDAG